VILVTTSRGGEIGWEIEAIEGGHGMDNPAIPRWTGPPTSTARINSRPRRRSRRARGTRSRPTAQGNTLPSQLPLDAILAATEALGLTDVAIDQGTSGNFLSGFLGLHGVYYNLHGRPQRRRRPHPRRLRAAREPTRARSSRRPCTRCSSSTRPTASRVREHSSCCAAGRDAAGRSSGDAAELSVTRRGA
jgi:hypothetical protein